MAIDPECDRLALLFDEERRAEAMRDITSIREKYDALSAEAVSVEAENRFLRAALALETESAENASTMISKTGRPTYHLAEIICGGDPNWRRKLGKLGVYWRDTTGTCEPLYWQKGWKRKAIKYWGELEDDPVFEGYPTRDTRICSGELLMQTPRVVLVEPRGTPTSDEPSDGATGALAGTVNVCVRNVDGDPLFSGRFYLDSPVSYLMDCIQLHYSNPSPEASEPAQSEDSEQPEYPHEDCGSSQSTATELWPSEAENPLNVFELLLPGAMTTGRPSPWVYNKDLKFRRTALLTCHAEPSHVESRGLLLPWWPLSRLEAGKKNSCARGVDGRVDLYLEEHSPHRLWLGVVKAAQRLEVAQRAKKAARGAAEPWADQAA